MYVYIQFHSSLCCMAVELTGVWCGGCDVVDGSRVEGQPLSWRKAEVTVRMGTLVAVVNVRVEMNVVLALRAKLLTTVWGKREKERENWSTDRKHDTRYGSVKKILLTLYKATYRCDDPYLVQGRQTGGLVCESWGGFWGVTDAETLGYSFCADNRTASCFCACPCVYSASLS